jgi:hypothetical protein
VSSVSTEGVGGCFEVNVMAVREKVLERQKVGYGRKRQKFVEEICRFEARILAAD